MRTFIVASFAGIALASLAGCMPPVPEAIGPTSSAVPGAEVEPEPSTAAVDDGAWLEPAPSAGEVDVSPIGTPRERQAVAIEEAEPAAGSSGQLDYVVPRDKTLYAISREQGVALKDLIAANRLSPPYHLAAGQKLVIPGGGRAVARRNGDSSVVARSPDKGPPVAVVARAEADEASVAPRPVPRPAVEIGTQAKPAALQMTPSSTEEIPTAAVAEQRQSGLPPRAGQGFLWPVKGTIVARFGNLGGGKQSDGIAIAVPRGTPVKAAENGVVVYAGSDLKAYGKLLLIRHADGWMTAYAYNDDLVVHQGEVVKRGQVVARAGATGNVKDPQTYFEIRHEGRPVDPLPRLAES